MPAEWNHPRRAAKETIDYLTQMHVVLEGLAPPALAAEPPPEDEEGDELSPAQVVDNVLAELRHSTASAMEDRRGSEVVETLARKASPRQLRTLLARCRGYALSLANNRYSSHCLQTMLSLAGPAIAAETASGAAAASAAADESGGDGSEEEVPLLTALLPELAAEAAGAWAELFRDVSGSHSARALIQVLGGLPVMAERRGKSARHAHSVRTATWAPAAPRNAAASTVATAVTTPAAAAQAQVDAEAAAKWGWATAAGGGAGDAPPPPPPAFVEVLEGVVGELSALPRESLQAMTCHACGCPALVTLLRVMAHVDGAYAPSRRRHSTTTPTTTPSLPRLREGGAAFALAKRALAWSDDDASDEEGGEGGEGGDHEQCTATLYAMAGERAGSHFLEAVLALAPRGFADAAAVRMGLTAADGAAFAEYCDDNVANFLVQAVLQHVTTPAAAAPLAAAAAARARPLLRGRRARPGVVWRAAQAAARLSLPDAQGALAAAVAAAAPLPRGTGDDDTATPSISDGGDAFAAARRWVPALIELRLPGDAAPTAPTADNGDGGGDGDAPPPAVVGKLTMDVPGARIVENVLRFRAGHAAPAAKAVAALPEAALEAVACDGLASSCLLDPMFDAGSEVPADARKALTRRLRGRLAALTRSRAGAHLVLRLWRAAAAADAAAAAAAADAASGGKRSSSGSGGGAVTAARRAIAAELAEGGGALAAAAEANPGGRAVMREVMVERFSRDPKEWEAALERRAKTETLLDDILGETDETAGKKKRKRGRKGSGGGDGDAADGDDGAADGGDGDGDEGAGGGGGAARKRKRSRGRRGGTGGGSAAADGDGDGDGGSGGDGKKGKTKALSELFMEDLGFSATSTSTSTAPPTAVGSGDGTDASGKKGRRRKRRGSSGGGDGDGGDGGGGDGDGGADLSFIMDAIRDSAAAEEGVDGCGGGGGKRSKSLARSSSGGDDAGGGAKVAKSAANGDSAVTAAEGKQSKKRGKEGEAAKGGGGGDKAKKRKSGGGSAFRIF